MNVIPSTKIPDVAVVEPKVFEDERGFFFDFYRKSFLSPHWNGQFVQASHSRSRKGVLRGLHFQKPNSQAKLVRAIRGEVFDVAVDIRKGSPTFGRWVGEVLSESNRRMLFMPEGFAHGFAVLSDEAEIMYLLGDEYHPENEASVLWNDPDIGVEWPVSAPQLSPKDEKGMSLSEYLISPKVFSYDRSTESEDA